MNNFKIKLSFLFFDLLFEQFCIDIDKRSLFLKKIFSTWDPIKEKTGFNYRTSDFNYFIFRDWLENISLELRSEHKEFLFSKDKDNTFHCKGLTYKVMKQVFEPSDKLALYRKTLDICLLDLNPYPWKIKIINEVQKNLKINNVQALKIRKEKVSKCLDLKIKALTMDISQKYYTLFLCSQLMFQSDGHLDRKEAAFLKGMFAKLGIDLPNWKNLESIISLGAFSGFEASDIFFSHEEKKFMVSIMSLVVMGDGDLAGKEVICLRQYFEKFDLLLDEVNHNSESLRCSIDHAISKFDTNKLALIFNVCLDLSLCDGVLHSREVDLLSRIYKRIDFSTNLEKEKFITAVTHVLIKSCAKIREVKIIFEKILIDLELENSRVKNILCELKFFYNHFSLNNHVFELEIMANYFLKDWDLHECVLEFQKIDNGETTPLHMMFYVKLISMSLDGKCSPCMHDDVSQGLNEIIMALKPSELSDSAIYYVMQAALFDEVLDSDEDQSIIQFMIHFGVSEERVNRVLQLHSIEIGKEFELSRFYQHRPIKL